MKQILFTKKEIKKKVEEIAHNINMKGIKLLLYLYVF
jgi:hypoxanthine-guanine phosphoribosyltransferase